MKTKVMMQLILCAGMGSLMVSAAAAPVTKPNLLIIVADDMGWSDVGCYGGEIQTPNLDKLAANGLRFTQFYNTSRCWSSRASILTGHYPQAVRRDLLPEVELTCTRVIIIHEGSIRESGTLDELQRKMSAGQQVIAELAAPVPDLREAWEHMAEVEHFDISAAEGSFHRCALTPRAGLDLRPQIFELAKARGWPLRELTRTRHSLEDIFVHVTRREQEEP